MAPTSPIGDWLRQQAQGVGNAVNAAVLPAVARGVQGAQGMVDAANNAMTAPRTPAVADPAGPVGPIGMPMYNPPMEDPNLRMMLGNMARPAGSNGLPVPQARGSVPSAPAGGTTIGRPPSPLSPGEWDVTNSVDAGTAAATLGFGMQNPQMGSGLPYTDADAARTAPAGQRNPWLPDSAMTPADSAYYRAAGGPLLPGAGAPSQFVSRLAGAAPSPTMPDSPYVAPPVSASFVPRYDMNAHGYDRGLVGYGLAGRGTGVRPGESDPEHPVGGRAPLFGPAASGTGAPWAFGSADATPPVDPAAPGGPQRDLGTPPLIGLPASSGDGVNWGPGTSFPASGPQDRGPTDENDWAWYAAHDGTFLDPFEQGGGGSGPGALARFAPSAGGFAPAPAVSAPAAGPQVTGAGASEQVNRPPLLNGEIPPASGAAVPALPAMPAGVSPQTAPTARAAAAATVGAGTAPGGGLIDPRTDTTAQARSQALFDGMKNRIANFAGMPGSFGYLHRLQYATQLALNSAGETAGRGMDNYNTTTGGITQQGMISAEQRRKTIADKSVGVIGHRQVVPGQPLYGTVPIEGPRELDAQGNFTGVATPFSLTGAGREPPPPGTPAPPAPTLVQFKSEMRQYGSQATDAELERQYNAMPKGP
jgi:hypothetical protein